MVRRHDSLESRIMMMINAHLSSVELEARYKAADEAVDKSHFHAVWLLSCGYEVEEVAELLRSRRAGFGSCGATTRVDPSALAISGSTTAANRVILTPAALSALRDRIKTAPDDGGLWSGPNVARWLADYH